jgi:glycosyltransferase involved in cell wall biosynthesis
MQRSDKVFNILHVVSKLPVGGVENMLLKIVKGYDKKQFNVRICCIKEGGKIADELQNLGYKIIVLNKMKGHGFDWFALAALYKLLKRKNIHILRTHQYHANLYGRIAGILAGVPVIIPSFHNLYESPNKPKVHRRLLNYFLSFFSDTLVAVSKSVASDMVRFDRVNPEKIKIIYNGIATEEFNCKFSKQEARKFFNLPFNSIVIGSVGRLTEQKGHRYLIEAVSKLGDNCIVFAGDGPKMEELKNIANCFKANCIFMGRIDPLMIPMFLSALDIFCFPSLWEGFGTAIVEAMLAGLPIVVSDIPPHREVVDDAGILVHPGNAEALARALKVLIDNPSLRFTFGKKAKVRAKIFSIENTVKAYECLFEEILRYKGLL